MGTKYDNLRSKTIFDFTRDEKILKDVFSESAFNEYRENKNEFIENYKNWINDRAIVNSLVMYSELIKNKKLYTSLKNEFEDEFPSIFSDGI